MVRPLVLERIFEKKPRCEKKHLCANTYIMSFLIGIELLQTFSAHGYGSQMTDLLIKKARPVVSNKRVGKIFLTDMSGLYCFFFGCVSPLLPLLLAYIFSILLLATKFSLISFLCDFLMLFRLIAYMK